MKPKLVPWALAALMCGSSVVGGVVPQFLKKAEPADNYIMRCPVVGWPPFGKPKD